jgi:hypothetical protein
LKLASKISTRFASTSGRVMFDPSRRREPAGLDAGGLG